MLSSISTASEAGELWPVEVVSVSHTSISFSVCVLMSSSISIDEEVGMWPGEGEGLTFAWLIMASTLGGLCCSCEGTESVDEGTESVEETGDLTSDLLEVSAEVRLQLVVGVDLLLLKTSPRRPGGVAGVRGVGNVEHTGVASITGVDAVKQRGESSKDSSSSVVSTIALVFPLVWYCLRVPSATILELTQSSINN